MAPRSGQQPTLRQSTRVSMRFIFRTIFWFAVVATLMPSNPLKDSALAQGPLTFDSVMTGLANSVDSVSFSCAENPKLCDAAVDLFSEASGLMDDAAGGLSDNDAPTTP